MLDLFLEKHHRDFLYVVAMETKELTLFSSVRQQAYNTN